VLNEYISTHTAKLKSLSLNDLTKSDLMFQQAAFRNFDAAKKREIWQQKILLLLDTQNYSEAEYNHVAALLNHLHEKYFEPENILSEAIERKQFAQAWISKAKSELGWYDKEIAFVVYRLYTNEEQLNSEIKSYLEVYPDTIDPNGNCDCNTGNNFCAMQNCSAGSCRVTSGCGWLWSETCDGKCI
jgi:hypothetical protein